MGSDFPIPVTDEGSTLVGEVHRSALAEALAETSTADQDYEANAAENAALAAAQPPAEQSPRQQEIAAEIDEELSRARRQPPPI